MYIELHHMRTNMVSVRGGGADKNNEEKIKNKNKQNKTNQISITYKQDG